MGKGNSGPGRQSAQPKVVQQEDGKTIASSNRGASTQSQGPL